ncbi:hypothetical protein PPERSA_02487 [Pseudocohnilembus persalinus]|uniref:Uncharacterized protein n=1 Tax=Pseudocohnilembus persalinus TaxID=266149 RepID=A0A0V0QB65_PSEPJ|nr:hypothetical protein PPERSA_02487 [Pseudocohnilembus persalinus]|eukprot:KRW99375.1 hypothetical protein PPERSA_02487 [Pseudocohnilembus persalinus]
MSIFSPDLGLDPSALRLKVACSTKMSQPGLLRFQFISKKFCLKLGNILKSKIHEQQYNYIFIKYYSDFLIMSIFSPDLGLDPSALRLKVACSTKMSQPGLLKSLIINEFNFSPDLGLDPSALRLKVACSTKMSQPGLLRFQQYQLATFV